MTDKMENIIDLYKEEHRLLTFKNWPKNNIQDKEVLAKIGFYFTGYEDMTACYFCKVTIGMWEPEDDPVEEHVKWSINCSLIRGIKTTNVPICEEAFKKILPEIGYDVCGIYKDEKLEDITDISINRPNPSNIYKFSGKPKQTGSFPCC